MIFEVIKINKPLMDSINYNAILFLIRAEDVLDYDRAQDLDLFTRTLVQGGARKVLVDMSGVEFVDSLGLGVLIELAKLIRSHRGDIALYNVTQPVEQVMKPLNFNRFMKIFSTGEEYMNFFRSI